MIKGFDYMNPDYRAVYAERLEKAKMLEDPKLVIALKRHYATHPWDFINDWAVTFDPRNVEKGLMTNIPFVLWPKQEEFLKWLYARWTKSERGLVEKSRDCGVTWLSVGFAVSMWCNVDGFVTGFGSRKEELVDKKGDAKSIFEKVRFMIDNLPREFWPDNYVPHLHSKKMLVLNPNTDAAIIGEGGDDIGRGGRTSLTFVDEAAFIEHQLLVDAALSQNTNCQIDISTYNGNGNPFYKKSMRFDNTDRKFIFDWKDDPRKDQPWYDKQVEEQEEEVVAQEIDRDPDADQAESFIKAKDIKKCLDAHIRLGFRARGAKVTGFDPADVGDAKGVVSCHGSIIRQAKQMKSGNITHAIPWAFKEADDNRSQILGFDGDGMGAPTMKMALQVEAAGSLKIIAYHGSAGVMDADLPTKKRQRIEKKARQGQSNLSEDNDKTNGDTWANFRSQSWGWLKESIELTARCIDALEAGQHIMNVDPDDLISFSSEAVDVQQLMSELSRPKRLYSGARKILVESKPAMKKRGVSSPNLADACVVARAMMRMKPPKKNDPYNEPMKTEVWGEAVRGVM